MDKDQHTGLSVGCREWDGFMMLFEIAVVPVRDRDLVKLGEILMNGL